jgi:hypothetical protein
MARVLARALVLLSFSLIGCEGGAPPTLEPEPMGGRPATGSTGSAGATCEDSAFGCSFGQFCDKLPGTCDGGGVCTNAPLGCSGECLGACGCDGVYYCNACVALRAGVDIDEAGDCEAPAASYQAIPLSGDPARLLLLKSDVAADFCTRVMLVANGAPAVFDVVLPEPWSIESMLVTDHALDCTLGPSGPPPAQGASVVPSAATGTIEMEEPQIPCSVGADLSLEVDAAFAGPTVAFEMFATLVLCE